MTEHARPQHYILIDRVAVAVDLDTWSKNFSTIDRSVCKTEIGGMKISTVFMGLDHNYRLDGPPILFETMIFGDIEDTGDQWRCSTWMQAEAMHQKACDLVRSRMAVTQSLAASLMPINHTN
jgi:hypothetical protein